MMMGTWRRYEAEGKGKNPKGGVSIFITEDIQIAHQEVLTVQKVLDAIVGLGN